MHRLLPACLLVLATLTLSLAAQDALDRPRAQRPIRTPPALEVYKGRRIAQTMHYLGAEWLTRDNREQQERCSLDAGATWASSRAWPSATWAAATAFTRSSSPK